MTAPFFFCGLFMLFVSASQSTPKLPSFNMRRVLLAVAASLRLHLFHIPEKTTP